MPKEIKCLILRFWKVFLATGCIAVLEKLLETLKGLEVPFWAGPILAALILALQKYIKELRKNLK
jgi:hypothetical protein